MTTTVGFKERCEEAYAELIKATKDLPGFQELTYKAKRDVLYTEQHNPMITLLLVETKASACQIGFYYNDKEMGVVTAAKPGGLYSGHVVHKGITCPKEVLVEFAAYWLTATTVETLNKLITSKSKA